MKEERQCEICNHFVAVMSEAAWLARDRLCDDCKEEDDRHDEDEAEMKYWED